ncbi:hypothetical protein HPB49_018624 [Dermacentor silvarum]|uniref:Uncharacterized protein n=1 Tax=Dermacentor silvarum TaxID=543639 RepID=A0ACB8CGQ3_DERSI|nr:hypothetical protein HPB49_018624 [Dermacentor silvarum]
MLLWWRHDVVLTGPASPRPHSGWAQTWLGLDDGKANWKCLAQAATESLGRGNTPAYYSVMACVSAIKNERPLYKACPNESCNNKKMFDQDAGDYYLCEKCISLTKNFKWYPHIQAKLADYSGEQWITCFGEQAERLIGVPANTLGELYEASGPSDSRLEDTLEDVTFKKFIFRLHTKKDVYNLTSLARTLSKSTKFRHGLRDVAARACPISEAVVQERESENLKVASPQHFFCLFPA